MAEINRRELILDRLLVLLGTVDGVVKAFRNRLDIPENQRPAVVILDADEEAEEAPTGRGRPIGVSPFICTMSPEIYIVAAPSTPSENVGSVLNTLRSAVIKAVTNDETLISLTKDGDISYLGFATGLASGRSMEGEAGISFRFRYMIRPQLL